MTLSTQRRPRRYARSRRNAGGAFNIAAVSPNVLATPGGGQVTPNIEPGDGTTPASGGTNTTPGGTTTQPSGTQPAPKPTTTAPAPASGGLSGFGTQLGPDGRPKIRLSPTDPDIQKLLVKYGADKYEITTPDKAAPYLAQLAKEGNSTQTYVGPPGPPSTGTPAPVVPAVKPAEVIPVGQDRVYDHGGVLDEEVDGIGQITGDRYRFAHKGPVMIEPNPDTMTKTPVTA